MGYGRGDSFPFDFEPNGFPFGSKSKGKLSPRSYPTQCERKRKYNFLSARLVITREKKQFIKRNNSPFTLITNGPRFFIGVIRHTPRDHCCCLLQDTKLLLLVAQDTMQLFMQLKFFFVVFFFHCSMNFFFSNH